jgi:chromosome segregation ATPase
MSLDMTKVIDKLKPIEKRQKDAEAYFRNREKYEKKFMQFDFSIKSKLFDKKTKEGIEEKMVSKTSALIKKLLELDPKVFSQLNQNLGEFTDHTTQTEEDEFQIIMTKVNNLEAENEKLKKKSQKYKKEVGVTNQEVTNLKAYISRLEREGKQAADTIDKLSKDNELLNTKVSDLSAKLNEANDKLAKNEKMTDQYNQMKTLIEERINIENEKHKVQENKETKIKQKYSNHLYGLLYYDVKG